MNDNTGARALTLVSTLVLGLALGSTACDDSGPETSPTTDTDRSDGNADVGSDLVADDVSSDDTGAPDSNVGQDTEADMPQVCEGACATHDLTIAFALGSGALSRTAYGLTPPEAAGAPWTLYIESWQAGFEGCPQETSPTPDRTLILAGIPLDEAGQPTRGGDLTATLLDYQGVLLESEVFTRALAVQVELRGANLCTDCVGQTAPSHPEGYLSLTLTATFPEGTITGGIYATHCDSLDE